VRPTVYVADLHKLSEDDRIRILGTHAESKLIGAALEKDQPEKIARYIRKMEERHPKVRHYGTVDGPAAGMVLVRFGPRQVN
jgi:hypothetical protein